MKRSLKCFTFIAFTIVFTANCHVISANQDSATISTKKFKTGNNENKTTVPFKNANIQVDNKITDEEKQQYNAIVDQANRFTNDQAAALNKVPGVEVSQDDLKETEHHLASYRRHRMGRPGGLWWR